MPSILEFLRTRRTCRRFLPKAVPDAVLREALEAARIASCGSNRQTLKYALVQSPAAVAELNRLVHWAAYLPPEQGAPKPEEQPVLFVAMVQDTSIPGDKDTDAGIALANLTLAAWAKGVGSCIMGAIDRPRLAELLGLGENEALHTMVALGYPAHAAHIVPLTEATGVKYYLDAQRDYCVPKRDAKELARYL